MENIPVNPTPPAAGWTPTKATVVGGGTGAIAAQLIVFALDKFGVEVDTVTAVAIANALGILFTYLHPASAGRS